MNMTFKGALGFTALVLLMPCVEISTQCQAAGATNQPTSAALEHLQGTWQGEMVGHESTGKITITISSNSFHFHRDTNFWFETTITLPPGTNPQQLHATIKGSADSQGDAVGKVVVAIFKIEDGTLTIAVDGPEEPPKAFSSASSLYVLKQLQPQKKKTDASTLK